MHETFRTTGTDHAGITLITTNCDASELAQAVQLVAGHPGVSTVRVHDFAPTHLRASATSTTGVFAPDTARPEDATLADKLNALPCSIRA